MIKRECKDSGTTFEEYSTWCEAGGGDEWFQEEAAEIPPPTEEQLQKYVKNIFNKTIF